MGGLIIIVIVSYILYIGQSWILSRFLEITEHYYWIRIILNLLQLQFNFTLGAVAAKVNFFDGINSCLRHKYISIIICMALVALIWFQCMHGTAFYAFIFIALVNSIRVPAIISKLLQKLGNQSMNIWLIHTWICYYLFHDFIYGFRYPMIVFTTLLIISYIIAIGVDIVSKPIEKLIQDGVKPITKFL